MQQKLTKEKVDEAYQPLMDYMRTHYFIELKVSEMNGIIEAVEKVNENTIELYREKCDVAGCNNDPSGGGSQWSDTGYWVLCDKHYSDGMNGLPQPGMKQEAIDRENSRGKDGILPPEKPYPFE